MARLIVASPQAIIACFGKWGLFGFLLLLFFTGPQLVSRADGSETAAQLPELPLKAVFDVAFTSMNRSMGLEDLYPFVLSSSVIDKLRFVHQMIDQARC